MGPRKPEGFQPAHDRALTHMQRGAGILQANLNIPNIELLARRRKAEPNQLKYLIYSIVYSRPKSPSYQTLPNNTLLLLDFLWCPEEDST
jgi:hypothetical protein